MVVDSGGAVHLTGIEKTREETAAVFYIHWDGASWLGHDTIRLGYNFVDGVGARAVLSSEGLLTVISRVLIPTAGGANHYVILYVGRQLGVTSEVIAIPTFTPQPKETLAPATVQPTITPASLSGTVTGGGNTGDNVLLKIGLVAGAMIIVSGVAVVRLWKRMAR
jgi:hypothetical protein